MPNFSFKSLIIPWFLLFLLAGCAPVAVISSAPQNIVPTPPQTIKPQDTLMITVKGEADLSGDYTVNEEGAVTMPLIGDVSIAGKTLAQASETLKNAYQQGYLVSPVILLSRKTQCPCPVPESKTP
jgi:polysaccharide biosynthesis/export protein